MFSIVKSDFVIEHATTADRFVRNGEYVPRTLPKFNTPIVGMLCQTQSLYLEVHVPGAESNMWA